MGLTLPVIWKERWEVMPASVVEPQLYTQRRMRL